MILYVNRLLWEQKKKVKIYGSIINSVGEKSLTLFLVIKKGVTSETHDTM